MVNPEMYAEDLALWEAGDGPHPSHLSETEWAEYLSRRA